ncbi:MAG: hypothetical protein AAF802_20500 [Planctomycetota bacterium]
MVPFTIFNCGTGYHRNSNDVVANLFKEVDPQHRFITDGPGSQGSDFDKFRGGITGHGVGANVNRAVDEIRERYERLQERSQGTRMVVNLIGWSRGAVTCFKIANKLNRDRSELSSMVRCNIYAIDPVPGGGTIPGAKGIVNGHMWRDIRMTPNIGMCSIVYAQHDWTERKRSLFIPFIPKLQKYVDVELMPGNHAELVEKTDRNPEAHRLVRDLAKRFLMARKTRFINVRDNPLLTDDEILEKYSKMLSGFDAISDKAKGRKVLGFKKTVYPKGRPKREKKEKLVLNPSKPSFFINSHHREVFTRRFPKLAARIDRTARGNSRTIQENWRFFDQEFRMLDTLPYAATRNVVYDYFELALV